MENSVPTDSLSRAIPLLVVQATGDQQVPYDVTLSSVHIICAHGVSVTFKVTGGDHSVPLSEPLISGSILPWAQQRIRRESVINSCGSLPAG